MKFSKRFLMFLRDNKEKDQKQQETTELFQWAYANLKDAEVETMGCVYTKDQVITGLKALLENLAEVSVSQTFANLEGCPDTFMFGGWYVQMEVSYYHISLLFNKPQVRG
jgi:hypothetical protein